MGWGVLSGLEFVCGWYKKANRIADFNPSQRYSLRHRDSRFQLSVIAAEPVETCLAASLTARKWPASATSKSPPKHRDEAQVGNPLLFKPSQYAGLAVLRLPRKPSQVFL
jgi:hypothetical protein